MTMTEAIRDAAARGYRVDDAGNLIGPTNVVSVAKSTENRPYRQFTLRLRNSRKTAKVFVHRLAAYQKFGDKLFEPGIVVRHLNGNPADNSASNIAIGTASDNMMDQPKEVRIRKAALAARKHDVSAIRAFYKQVKSYAKTRMQFGITSNGTLHYILNNALESVPT